MSLSLLYWEPGLVWFGLGAGGMLPHGCRAGKGPQALPSPCPMECNGRTWRLLHPSAPCHMDCPACTLGKKKGWEEKSGKKDSSYGNKSMSCL